MRLRRTAPSAEGGAQLSLPFGAAPVPSVAAPAPAWPPAAAGEAAAAGTAAAIDAPGSAQPAAPAPAGAMRRVMLSGQPCLFRLRRGRRRTIGFQIDDHGLTVSAPRWISVREIEAAIVEKQRWIRSKLEQWQAWRLRRAAPAARLVDGATLPFLGKPVTLRLCGGPAGGEGPPGGAAALVQSTSVRELRLPLPLQADPSQIRQALQRWMMDQARHVLGERLELLAARGGVRPLSWKLSSARTQWGACNEDGRIRLNWRLLFYPVDVIDYVVAHELAHLAELNHSPRFWQEVARLLPQFEAARARIKEEELACLPL
jgi:predicted metal-dependent hydrolase